jgi:ferrous iron transport protein A
MTPTHKTIPLSKLRSGQRAVIRAHVESDFRLMLLEMGCVPGEPVWIEMVAPLGDPLAIRIAGYHLSIRKKDAERILVEVEG